MTGHEDGPEGVREEFPRARFHAEELRPGAWSVVASILLGMVGLVSGFLVAQRLLGPVYPGNNWMSVFAMILLTWFLILPLAQYLLLRFLGGGRPELFWAGLVPNVFGFLRAIGHRFDRNTFALVCALPFCVAWILFPLLASLIPGGWGNGAPLVGATMGVSLYFLRYSALALSKPRGTLVEELVDEGGVRFYEPVRNESPRRTP